MDPLPVPEGLAATARHSPDVRAWVAELPGTVRALVDRWRLRVGAPFQPGGTCSWTAPARDPAGRDLVLKVGWAHDESAHEADGLRLWDGRGTVRLYDAHTSGRAAALLLERCRPGTTLAELRAGPDQDAVVAGLLRRLWAVPPAGPFRPLARMCGDWADQFEAHLAAGQGGAAQHELDPGLARAAMALLRELPGTATASALLATDLHAENVLSAAREPWLVIDPKPYVGDPTYDVLQHMLNGQERLERDPVGFARRMAGLLDLNADRILRWLFARAVEDSVNAPWLIPVARQVAPR